MLKNILSLEGVSLLSKGEQKNVTGGTGTCCAIITHGGGTFNNGAITQTCGLSMSQAKSAALSAALQDDTRGQWCCDSC
jgi:hypothetical protein